MTKLTKTFTPGTPLLAADLNAHKDAINALSDEKSDRSELPLTGGVYASVDLGLPSGRLWARMNVGAKSETDYGDLFAWGATSPYRQDAGDHTDNYAASAVNKIQRDLLPNEDAATVHMGSGWRMPSKADYDELLANTDVEWTSIGGVNGRKFMKKSDHSVYVFFPAAGYWDGASLNSRGSGGLYWCRQFNSSAYAWRLYFSSGGQGTYASSRYNGFSVRGVRS